MAAKIPAITGRKLIEEAYKQNFKPTSNGFGEFIKNYIYEYFEFSMESDQDLDQDISDFLDNWCSHVASLFRNKKYQYKIDYFLKGNHPSYFDREIRFVQRKQPSPQPSGS